MIKIGRLVHWFRKPEEETPEFRARLSAIVLRAQVASLTEDGSRCAYAAGPDGPMWADSTTALVHFDEQMRIAA